MAKLAFNAHTLGDLKRRDDAPLDLLGEIEPVKWELEERRKKTDKLRPSSL